MRELLDYFIDAPEIFNRDTPNDLIVFIHQNKGTFHNFVQASKRKTGNIKKSV